MKSGITNNTCIICSNNNFVKPFDNGKFAVLECANCKFGIVTPIPSEQELTELYNSKEYFSSHMNYNYDTLTDSQINGIIKQSFQLHGQHLKNYINKGASLLEIGPGGGFSLKAFEQAGLLVKGVETSSSSAEFAEKRLNLKITRSDLEGYKDDNQYDIVMLNHVLEHFVDIHLAMSILYKLVAPLGILYIRVPDHNSYDRKAYKENWPAYLPFHISYFSEQSISVLLESNNFKVLEVKKYISEKFLEDYPSFLQKILKKVIIKAGLKNHYSGRTITIIAKKI